MSWTRTNSFKCTQHKHLSNPFLNIIKGSTPSISIIVKLSFSCDVIYKYYEYKPTINKQQQQLKYHHSFKYI